MLKKYERRDHTLLRGDQVCTRSYTYTITEVRSIGGSGIIYAATREGSQAQYVLKEFFPNKYFHRQGVRIICNHSKELREEYAARFKKESDLSAMLYNHSRRIIRLDRIRVTRIVHKGQVYTGNAVKDCLFGLMDDLAGAGDFLSDLWDGKDPMNAELALKVMLQVLRALDACHSQGYRHGDLSLGNLYFMEWDTATAGIGNILDFTLSTHVGGEGFDDEPAVDRGTYPFFAPEIRDPKLRGLHSDVWSAARLMLLLLTCSDSFPDLSQPLLRPEDLPYIQCTPALAAELNRVLATALEPDPMVRRNTYPNAATLYNDLKALLPLARRRRYRLCGKRIQRPE